MPNDLPKVPHINQLAAGWAGVEILTLILRFAITAPAGNGLAEFVQLGHPHQTFNSSKMFRNYFSAC